MVVPRAGPDPFRGPTRAGFGPAPPPKATISLAPPSTGPLSRQMLRLTGRQCRRRRRRSYDEPRQAVARHAKERHHPRAADRPPPGGQPGGREEPGDIALVRAEHGTLY